MTTADGKASQPLTAEQMRRLLRWRMALGRYSDNRLGSSGLQAEDLRRDQLLERIYAERGRQRGLRLGGNRKGSLDPSQIAIPDWLSESRNCFQPRCSKPFRAMRSTISALPDCSPIRPRCRSCNLISI